jgi:hypothetical protein
MLDNVRNAAAADANCETRKRRVIMLGVAAGSLATLAGFVLQALDADANTSHFIAGFGAGLTAVASIALVRIRRRLI